MIRPASGAGIVLCFFPRPTYLPNISSVTYYNFVFPSIIPRCARLSSGSAIFAAIFRSRPFYLHSPLPHLHIPSSRSHPRESKTRWVKNARLLVPTQKRIHLAISSSAKPTARNSAALLRSRIASTLLSVCDDSRQSISRHL